MPKGPSGPVDSSCRFSASVLRTSSEQALPAAQLVEVFNSPIGAGRPVGPGAPRAVDPAASSTLTASLKLGLPAGPGGFLLAGSLALIARNLPVSAALRAMPHCAGRSSAVRI